MERIHERQKGHIKAIYGLAPEDDFDEHKARVARDMRPDYMGVYVERDAASGHVDDTVVF